MQADTTTLAPTDLCRSEFEAWHIAEVRKIFPVDGWSDAEIIEGTAGPRRHGSYRADGMQRAWKAWQAAWNRRAPTLTPTDAEIEAAYRKVWSTIPHAQRLSAFAHEIASTLAARWGAPAPASDALRTAAQAIVARWDTPHWKDAEHTGAFIQRLREALVAPPAQEAQLNPDMPVQELRLHMGELTTDEVLVARAAIRWANSQKEARVPLSDEQKREMVTGYFAEDWAIENALHLLDDFERHGITAAQKPQAPDLIAAAEAIYALRNLDSHDLPCIEAWPDEFAALGRAITAQKETPNVP